MKRSAGHVLPPALLLLCLSLCAACSASLSPTACDGLSRKTLAITRADYAECAGQILAALEQVEGPLGRFVAGDAEAGAEASSAHRRLRHMMDVVGFQAGAYREVGGGADKTIQRWPDSGMRTFNGHVISAAVQFRAALVHPNQDNFEQGARGHANARAAYARFR